MRKTAICLFIAVAGAMSAVAQLAVEKRLPVSFGVDSRGGNRLQGRFLDARVYSRVWTDGEARAYFDQLSNSQTFKPSNLVWSGVPKIGETCEAVRKADYSNGFTFACRVVIDKVGGRLIDNATPGGYDGWIIDTYGGSVRFFRPGGVSTRHPLRLETGKPQCIVVTVTDDDGITIWQNGERHRVGYRNNQRYTPIAGGYEITDGEAVFSRVLYGWHGNDWKKVPRIFVLTSDRPRVRLLANPSRTPLGEVSFDCSGRVRYRYVFGRAEYELEGRGRIRMARSGVSEDMLVEVTGDIPAKVSGNVAERGRATRDGKTYYAFNRADTRDRPPSDLPKAFDDAVARLEGLSRTLVVNTPDKELDSVILCENIAMDGVREGDCLGHAALSWRDPFPGWRVSYGLIALGRDEAFRAFARAHFSSQTKEGRVTSNMGMRDSIYSFNEPFVDAVLRYWLRSGDDAFMRAFAYEGVKRHLAYMEKYIRVPGTDLYENFLNAWNTDDKWCNGGAGTIASAYARFAYRAMARAAERFGRKADAAANQNLRTLHARTYTPMTGRFPWCTWGPSTRSIEPNGRSWWIQRAGGNKFNVPGKFDIPADGIVRSGTGIPFKLDARDGTNAVFTSLYDQLPAMRTIPLSGKGTKIAFLVAVSTNPNIAWTEAARITVTYVDGVSESVSLVPPDNCDDWLNYGKGNPYHLKGDHIQLAGRAHVNVIAIPLDPSKELSKATIECRATETLAGIAAATLCQPVCLTSGGKSK